MGLDNFISGKDTDDNNSNERDTTHQPNLNVIGNYIRDQAATRVDGINVEGRVMRGEDTDFALLFALLALDYDDAELEDLYDSK